MVSNSIIQRKLSIECMFIRSATCWWWRWRKRERERENEQQNKIHVNRKILNLMKFVMPKREPQVSVAHRACCANLCRCMWNCSDIIVIIVIIVIVQHVGAHVSINQMARTSNRTYSSIEMLIFFSYTCLSVCLFCAYACAGMQVYTRACECFSFSMCVCVCVCVRVVMRHNNSILCSRKEHTQERKYEISLAKRWFAN